MFGYNISSGGSIGGGCCSKVAQYDLDGNLLNVYPSTKNAYESLNLKTEYSTRISYASTHENSTAYGFMWKQFSEEPLNKIDPYIDPWKVSVLQYDLDGNFIKEWNCIADAQREIKGCTDICDVCKGELKTAGGYQWTYKTNENIPNNIGSADSKNKKKKHVYVYDMDGNYISDYYGISSAFRAFGIDPRNATLRTTTLKNISKNNAYGYRWTDKYYDKLPPLQLPKGNRPVVKIDNDTKEIVDIFASVKDAANSVNVTHTSIYSCCNGKNTLIKGYNWEFAENIDISKINNKEMLDLYNSYMIHINVKAG
jgi:hypothetical protein